MLPLDDFHCAFSPDAILPFLGAPFLTVTLHGILYWFMRRKALLVSLKGSQHLFLVCSTP